jgi:glutamate 5-kinase
MKPYRRIVVKIGTSLLTGGGTALDPGVVSGLVAQVAQLRWQGSSVVIVSSGAVALGWERLGITRRRRGIPFKQVLASVGQSRLMNLYEKLFDAHNITVAQALLSKTDLDDRIGYLNARNTLQALLEYGVVPVVNENDVVAVDELGEEKFGDNDNLSALVATLVDAQVLILLSDVGGLYTADPRCDGGACLMPEVSVIDDRIMKLAANTRNGMATGGMITKIESASLATRCGVRVIIANGNEPGIILRLAAGEADGTHFLPVEAGSDSRRRWLLSGLAVKGRLTVDEGAAVALKKGLKSLLAAGIMELSGRFQRGDIVGIYDPEDRYLGCGLTNYSSKDINRIKGLHSRNIRGKLGYEFGTEVLHRNNMALINKQERDKQ